MLADPPLLRETCRPGIVRFPTCPAPAAWPEFMALVWPAVFVLVWPIVLVWPAVFVFVWPAVLVLV